MQSFRTDSTVLQGQSDLEVTDFGYPRGYPLQGTPGLSISSCRYNDLRSLAGSSDPDYLAVRAASGVPRWAALGSAIASPGPHGPTTGGGGSNANTKCPLEPRVMSFRKRTCTGWLRHPGRGGRNPNGCDVGQGQREIGQSGSGRHGLTATDTPTLLVVLPRVVFRGVRPPQSGGRGGLSLPFYPAAFFHCTGLPRP